MAKCKLRKCAKFVASLFSIGKSKKESAVIQCITDDGPVSGCEKSDSSAATSMLLRGEFDDDRDKRSSSKETTEEDETDYCSWEPDLSSKCNSNGDNRQEEDEPQEYQRCLWKPNESSFDQAPVELSLFVWELESKMIKIRDDRKLEADRKPKKIDDGSRLKQEMIRKRQHLLLPSFLSINATVTPAPY